MKIFSIEFLTFNGIDTICRLCGDRIQDRQEEAVIPVVYFDKEKKGAVCDSCYRDLPTRVRDSRLPHFGG